MHEKSPERHLVEQILQVAPLSGRKPHSRKSLALFKLHLQRQHLQIICKHILGVIDINIFLIIR